MKKILFVIGTMTNGGAERVISVLVTWFCKQGYEVSVTTIIDIILLIIERIIILFDLRVVVCKGI